jgi:hypothetical protein
MYPEYTATFHFGPEYGSHLGELFYRKYAKHFINIGHIKTEDFWGEDPARSQSLWTETLTNARIIGISGKIYRLIKTNDGLGICPVGGGERPNPSPEELVREFNKMLDQADQVREDVPWIQN